MDKEKGSPWPSTVLFGLLLTFVGIREITRERAQAAIVPPPAVISAAGPEQVRAFELFPNNLQKTETEINAWLANGEGKIKITRTSQSILNATSAVMMIFYTQEK